MPIPGTESLLGVSEDETPDVTDERVCNEPSCNNPTIRKGSRGRWPKFCDEHKRSSAGTSVGRSSTNARLADQATAALVQAHGLVAAGCMLMQLTNTATAIANQTSEAFEEQARNALITDPELCRLILKAGTTNGRIALIITYAMFSASVVPVAVVELKDKRAVRAAKKAEEEAALEAENNTIVFPGDSTLSQNGSVSTLVTAPFDAGA